MKHVAERTVHTYNGRYEVCRCGATRFVWLDGTEQMWHLCGLCDRMVDCEPQKSEG